MVRIVPKDTGRMGRVDDVYEDDTRYFIHRISLAEPSPGPLIGCMDAVGCVRPDAIENPALRDATRICGSHERGASVDILIT